MFMAPALLLVIGGPLLTGCMLEGKRTEMMWKNFQPTDQVLSEFPVNFFKGQPGI
jgi:hypothetical protein